MPEVHAVAPIVPAAAEIASLRKLWLVLALISLVVALNVVDATQGGAVKLGVKAAIGVEFAKGIPEAVAALWGVIWLTIFVGLASGVMTAHARRAEGGWKERYPFRLFDLSTDRGTGNAAQWIAIVVLTLFPVIQLGHSWLVMRKHGVLCLETIQQGVWRQHFKLKDYFLSTPAPPYWAARLERDGAPPHRFTSSEKAAGTATVAGETVPNARIADACSDMTDYVAPAQTWLMMAASLITAGVFLLGIATVFRGRT